MFCSGLYIPLPDPQANPEPMKHAIVGCVLHSTNSLRTTDRWEEWIMDQSDRGHDVIVNDIYSTLTQEGEKCHKVSCTEHRGTTTDVQYGLVNVTRDYVSSFVRSLPFDDAHSSLCTGGRYCWQDTAVEDGHDGSWCIFDTQHLPNTSISRPQANPHMYDEY